MRALYRYMDVDGATIDFHVTEIFVVIRRAGRALGFAERGAAAVVQAKAEAVAIEVVLVADLEADIDAVRRGAEALQAEGLVDVDGIGPGGGQQQLQAEGKGEKQGA